MILTRTLASLALIGLLFSPRSNAQIPPAEQLLPEDILGLISVPDWRKLTAFNEQSPWGRLWADPAMKPFRENFLTNLQTDFIAPLEKELDLKLSEYQELLQGQLTVAFTPAAENTGDLFGILLLVDVKDKSTSLQQRLAALKKKWTEAGKEIRTEKIREVEFTGLTVADADIDAVLKRVFPGAEPEEPGDGSGDKMNLWIGQNQSLLIIGENRQTIEKVLARQSGGIVTPLIEQQSFQTSHRVLLRDSLVFGWVNFKPIYDRVLEMFTADAPAEGAPGMPNLRMDKVLPALGLAGLESIAGRATGNADGTLFEMLIGVPEAKREGIFKLLTFEKKDAAPPPFVPASAVKFQRWRIDAAKGWATIEEMLGKIEPSILGLIQLMISTAGKEQDPNFDLKKSLIGNLGDDFIMFQKNPASAKPEDILAPPSLILVGSPNANQLVDAFRLISSMMPPPLSSAPLSEREFLGKKIYTLRATLPTGPTETTDSAPATRSMSFAASSGYVAFSADDATLEEFIRSAEQPAKPLREMSGLAEASQKAGGSANGLFTFDNQAESVRVAMDLLKKDPAAFKATVFMAGPEGVDDESRFNRLFDVKLLPSYQAIARYFGIAVGTGINVPEGLVFKAYAPTPAGAR